jgi:DNA-directed RNA polymerase subunit H (RpoH/RPB5)
MSLNQEYGLISKLYKSRKNLLTQLGTIGFNVEDYNNSSINEINVLYQQNKQDMLLKSGDGSSLYINYSVDKALRPQNIHDLVEDLYHLESVLKANTNDYLIIVAKDGANDTLTNLLIQLYANEKILVSIVSLAELQFNIMEHSLVPKHTKLSSDETVQVKKDYNISDNSQFPKISRFELISRIIGMKPDDVCKIIRPSPTSITSIMYRICINK